MVHAYFMLDTYSYEHRLRICNIDCFCTATMVSRTRLNVTDTYMACLIHHILSNNIVMCSGLRGVSSSEQSPAFAGHLYCCF